MRSWQIILASAVAAIIADALLFLPGALPWRPETATLLLAHWPTIATVWLGVYGAAALVLTTLVVFLEIRGGAAPVRFGRDRAQRYVVRLAAAQYFTSNLCLFGLGLSRVPIETAPFRFLPTPISGSPALAVCGAVVVGGLLGELFLAAVLVRTERPKPESPAPGIRAARLLPKVSEPPPAQAPAAPNAAAEAAPLAELIEREQRPVLEAIRDLATAVNRLRRDLRHGLGEIKVALEDQRSGQSSEAGSASPDAVDHAATALRAVVAAVDTSVARLGEITSLMSANETSVVAGRDPPLSPASRSELSSELHALLRDMTPATGKDDPPR